MNHLSTINSLLIFHVVVIFFISSILSMNHHFEIHVCMSTCIYICRSHFSVSSLNSSRDPIKTVLQLGRSREAGTFQHLKDYLGPTLGR